MRNRKTKKLIEKFVRSYKIKLELPALIKTHLVVNISRIALYLPPSVEINRKY